MNNETLEVSKTSAVTSAMWVASLVLFAFGALEPAERPRQALLTASILMCGLAAAWTVRCFMRKYVNLIHNAYELGYDKGRTEQHDVPLQRVH